MYPENRDAWEVFRSSLTQWRRAGEAAEPFGLDYAAVAVVMEAQGVVDRKDCWARLRVLEGEALEAMRAAIAVLRRGHGVHQ